jgi:D-amino-acid dehydrogenase
MRALGCERQVISADDAVKIEPALSRIRAPLAGATDTAEDESGDANRFARELVKWCEAAGVRFSMSHTVTAIREAGGKVEHVEATDNEGRFQRITGDAHVLVQCATLFCTYSAPAASAAFARVTFARMSVALAVQMNGLGSML